MSELTKEEALRVAYRNLFSGPTGLEVFADLFEWCGGFSLSHVRGDPTETAFNEGMRNVLLRIIHLSGMRMEGL
jgi:hypothetical protein